MPSRYHPIEDGLWDDEKFDAQYQGTSLEEASFEERAFFVYLCSNRRQRPSGIYRATDEQLSAGCRLPLKRVVAYLGRLHTRGAIVRDGSWIFLPGYLKRQSKNERLLIGVQSDLDSCSSVVILEAFCKKYPLYSRWSTDRLQTITRRVNENAASEPPQNHHRTTTEPPPPPCPRAVPEQATWPSPEALVQKYNREATDNCPSVVSLSMKRIEKAKRYLRMFPEERWWTETFRQYHRSRFLSGKSPPGNGHVSFIPDFDWLLSTGKDGSENAVKVHDGRYCDAER